MKYMVQRRREWESTKAGQEFSDERESVSFSSPRAHSFLSRIPRKLDGRKREEEREKACVEQRKRSTLSPGNFRLAPEGNG